MNNLVNDLIKRYAKEYNNYLTYLNPKFDTPLSFEEFVKFRCWGDLI